LRPAEAAGLGDRGGTVVARNEPRGQHVQHLRRRRKVALQRVHAEQTAFIVIEIGEVEADFALAGHGDFHQPSAQGKTVDRATEHDAADQVEDHIRPIATGRRTNLCR
jgi:hypothetical protein